RGEAVAREVTSDRPMSFRLDDPSPNDLAAHRGLAQVLAARVGSMRASICLCPTSGYGYGRQGPGMFADDLTSAPFVAHDVRNLLQAALLGLERTALAREAVLDQAREAIGAAHSILIAAASVANEQLPRPVTKDVFFVVDLWVGAGPGGPVSLEIHGAPFVI